MYFSFQVAQLGFGANFGPKNGILKVKTWIELIETLILCSPDVWKLLQPSEKVETAWKEVRRAANENIVKNLDNGALWKVSPENGNNLLTAFDRGLIIPENGLHQLE